jgi:hypothetical protein
VQSSLAAQGIRVEALQGSGAAGQPFEQFNGRQDQPRRNHEPESYANFSEQDTNSTISSQPKRAEWRNRGWQRWA